MVTSALVVGGQDPPVRRSWKGSSRGDHSVTLFHSGRHEVDLPRDVAHVHGDPHFPETIAAALGDRSFDVVVAQYGRLRHLAEHRPGRTGQLVAIGGATAALALSDSPVWGRTTRATRVCPGGRSCPRGGRGGQPIRPSGRPRPCRHCPPCTTRARSWRPTSAIPSCSPRQPRAREWSVVRRLLDGRRRLIVPDGGIRSSREDTRPTSRRRLS